MTSSEVSWRCCANLKGTKVDLRLYSKEMMVRRIMGRERLVIVFMLKVESYLVALDVLEPFIS